MAIEVAGLPGIQHKLDPVQWGEGMRRALDAIEVEIARNARENLAGHSLSGRAAANVRGTVTGEGLSLELHVGVDTAAAPEAAILELGRRPGGRLPPKDVIADFLARTGGDADLAFSVAREIARRGLPALHWLQRAAEAAQPVMSREIASAIEGQIR